MVSIIFIARDFLSKNFPKGLIYNRNENRTRVPSINIASYIQYAIWSLWSLRVACALKACILKCSLYLSVEELAINFDDFVSSYWNRGNKSSLDKREKIERHIWITTTEFAFPALKLKCPSRETHCVRRRFLCHDFSYFSFIFSAHLFNCSVVNIVVLADCKFSFRRLDWSLALFEGCIENHLLDHKIDHKFILFAVKPCW